MFFSRGPGPLPCVLYKSWGVYYTYNLPVCLVIITRGIACRLRTSEIGSISCSALQGGSLRMPLRSGAARSGCRRGLACNATSSIWADPGCQHPRRGIPLVLITRHTQVICFYITRRRGCIISIKPHLPLRELFPLKNVCSVNF